MQDNRRSLPPVTGTPRTPAERDRMMRSRDRQMRTRKAEFQKHVPAPDCDKPTKGE